MFPLSFSIIMLHRLWRYFETKQYKRIKESQEFITEVATKYNEEAKNHPNSLVHAYEVGNELNSKDIATLVSDFLLAGIDTSANSMSFLLHEVSKHKDVQDDLERYHDVQRPDNELNENALKSFKLGKAIIKESLRLHPISVGVGRNLGEDAIFSGKLKAKMFYIFVGTHFKIPFINCRLSHSKRDIGGDSKSNKLSFGPILSCKA